MKKIAISIIILFLLSVVTAFIIQRAQTYQLQKNDPVTLIDLNQTNQVNIGKQNPLAGSWKWIQTNKNNEVINPINSGDFILTIDSDGKLESTTDCNFIGGSIVIDDSLINIGPLTATERYCEGDTQEAVYATDLARATTFSIQDEVLTFDLIQNGGQMIFEQTE